MSTDALQAFMTSGLLETVESEEMFQSLQKAVTSLAEQFASEPRDVIGATLIALDADAPPDEPTFRKAEEHIVVHWKTFRGRYKDRPRTILRAVLLAALAEASKSDLVAVAAWQTAASMLPRLRLGREEAAVTALFSKLARQAEEVGLARFDRSALPELKQLEPKLEAPDLALDKNGLILKVAAAVGPGTNISGAALTNPNPHWASDPSNWAYQFAPRMSNVISEAIQDAANKTAAALTEQLQDVVNSLGKLLHGASGLELQVRVLGWAHALYSVSLGRSYRTLDPVAAAIVMAHDLTRELAAPCPGSVAYTVGEAIRRFAGDEKRTVADVLTQLEAAGASVRAAVAKTPLLDGRVSLGAAAAAVVHGHESASLITKERIGLDPQIQVSIPDLAMWCFRDLQALTVAEGAR